MDSAPLIAIGALVVLIGAAVRFDLLEHRIPNALTGPALVFGLAQQAVIAGWSGVGIGVAGAVVGLAILLPFYLLRGMGAGDVKLMAAVGSFLGPAYAGLAAGCTLIVGAVFGIAVLVRRMVKAGTPVPDAVLVVSGFLYTLVGNLSWRADTVRREKFPYALAIGAGTMIVLWLRGDWSALVQAIARLVS